MLVYQTPDADPSILTDEFIEKAIDNPLAEYVVSIDKAVWDELRRPSAIMDAIVPVYVEKLPWRVRKYRKVKHDIIQWVHDWTWNHGAYCRDY